MLYIVGTPIGNLKEFSSYAIEILNNSEYILCEDTRTSLVLLKHYNINKPLKSYHKFNETKMLETVISDLKDGKDISLISDAGMPCVSDPGNILVNELIKNNLKYTVVSGPCALINAFILSGYKAPFTFVGFLPEKQKELTELLTELKNYKSALIFYVSCHDVQKTFDSLLKMLGNRNVCVVREISKMFEEVNFTTLQNGYNGVTKGEFVFVVEGNSDNNELLNLNIDEHIKHYLSLGLTTNDAVKQVAVERKLQKNEVYKIALKLKKWALCSFFCFSCVWFI